MVDNRSMINLPAKSIGLKRKVYDDSDNESLFSSISSKPTTQENNINSRIIKPLDKDMITLTEIVGCPRKEKKIMHQLGYLSSIEDVLLAKDALKKERKLSVETRALLLTFINWREGSEMRDINEYEECMDDKENKQYHKAMLSTLSSPPKTLMDTDNDEDVSVNGSMNYENSSIASCGGWDSDPEGSLYGYEEDGFILRG